MLAMRPMNQKNSESSSFGGNFSYAGVVRCLLSMVENSQSPWDIPSPSGTKYYLLVANTPELRERAYGLGARIYKQMGYIPEDGPNLLCNRFDADPETFVLLVTDGHGRDVATMTLVFDCEENGLPLDDIFQDDADRFRARGKRLAEIVRLAVDPSGRSGREVLIHLFNFAYVYAKHVKNYDGFLVTVNPRHAPFYERSWGFKVHGAEKPCPKVQNAPAVLLFLCFKYVSERALREAGRPVKNGEKATFYTHAYPTEAEPFIAAFLRNRHQPMTLEEAIRLGLLSNIATSRYFGRD